MRQCIPRMLCSCHAGPSIHPKSAFTAHLRSARPFSVLPTLPSSATCSSTSSTPSPSAFTPSTTKPYFVVTTPIFYVNASPHIGHLHSLVLTDVLARYNRLRNPSQSVLFTTGTDEHGLKIQQAAEAQGVGEGEFCDRVSERFRDLADRASIGYTDFIRTSEKRHHNAVEHFWGRLVASGDVYKGTHSGWYSIPDECFYTKTQITKSDNGKMVSVETGNEVVWEEEENWKFRLPKHKQGLIEWLNGAQTQAVYPIRMQNHVRQQIDSLEDLSISRPKSRVKWGVSVPGDPGQTIYVWVDALINYLTVLGYPESTEGWPADIHVVGKDIIKFHAVHWPALLMSAGYSPPTTVLAHAHWTMGRSKMSKSRGNVVDPISAMEVYGVDSVRWYLMRAGGSLPEDSDYSEEQLRSNHHILASQLGNLVARISSPQVINKVQVPASDKDVSMNNIAQLDGLLGGLRDEVKSRMEKYEVTRACEAIMNVVSEVNKLFTRLEPWRMENTTIPMIYAYTTLRLAGILIQPFMPTKSVDLLDRLGVDPSERTWEDVKWSGPQEVDTQMMVEKLLKAEQESKRRGHLFPKMTGLTPNDTALRMRR